MSSAGNLFLVAVAAILLVEAVVILLVTRPQAVTNSRSLATGAAWVFVGFQFALLLSPRTQTRLGATTTPNTVVSAVSAVAPYVTAALALWAVAVGKVGRGAPVARSLWAVVVAALISALTAGERGGPLPRALAVEVPLAVALVAGFDTSQSLLRTLCRIGRFVLGSCLVTAVAMPAFAFFTADTERQMFGLSRLMGVFNHPNALGVFACVFLMLEVVQRRLNPGRRRDLLWVVVAASTLLLSQSRGAGLAALAGLVVIALTGRNRGRWLTLGVVGTVVTWLLKPSLFDLGQLTGSSSDLSTVSGRTVIWNMALDEFQRHPWFGYGPNFLGLEYRNLFVPGELQQASNAHNEFLQALGQGGLLGVTAVVLFFLTLFVVGWKVRREDRSASLALAVTLAVMSLTEVTLSAGGLPAVAFIAVAALCGVALKARARDAVSDAPSGSEKQDAVTGRQPETSVQ